MHEPWIDEFAAKLHNLSGDGLALMEDVDEIVREIVGATFKHAERLCLEHEAAAYEDAGAVQRKEEIETHRRRAIEAKRIAAELAALRTSVEQGVDVRAELEALAEAHADPESLEPEPGEQIDHTEPPPGFDPDAPAPDLLAIAEEMAKTRDPQDLEHGEHTITIRTGALSTSSSEALLRLGAVHLEIAGPVRAVRIASERRAGGLLETETELTAPAVAIVAGGL